MMISRPRIEAALERALARAPVVALIGARQVGKTTLARKLADRAKGTLYLDLERIADRRKLEDAEAFLQAQAGHLTVLDEVQRLPELFAELRGIVDDRRAGGEQRPVDCNLVFERQAGRRRGQQRRAATADERHDEIVLRQAADFRKQPLRGL